MAPVHFGFVRSNNADIFRHRNSMYGEPLAALEYPELETSFDRCDPFCRRRLQLLDCLVEIEHSWRCANVEKACAIYRSTASAFWDVGYFKAGNSKSVSIDLKAIIRRIVNDDCNAIILCHSHPCGTTEPSQTDLRTTRKIAQICRALDVNLLDHIIFGRTRPFSFRQASYL